jgi:methyl-accepting chemotaxis protein WspA
LCGLARRRRRGDTLNKFSIKQRIVGSFALILAAIVAMGGFGYYYNVAIDRETTSIGRDSGPGLALCLQLMTSWETEYSLVQSNIIETDPTQIAAADAALNANHAAIDGLMTQYEATISEDQARRGYAAIKDLSSQYLMAESTIVKLGDADQKEQARDALKSELKPIFQQIQAALQTLIDFNQANVVSSTDQITASVAAANRDQLVGTAAAMMLAILCGFHLLRVIIGPLSGLLAGLKLMRQGDFSSRVPTERTDELGELANGLNRMADDLVQLIGQIQRTGISVSSSITEMAATSKQQQATASEIAATTTEIAATAKEISATSSALVRTMTDVAGVSEQTALLASGGQAALARMEETMGQVMEASDTIAAKLGTLNEKATNINQMLVTIVKVADQTNLLSLNAAIEAEKAGEYGRGFAVVATEIRRLSDQTAVSSYDINETVRDIQSAVAASVMAMDKFSEAVRRGIAETRQVGQQLTQIIHQVQGLAPQVESVNEGVQTQASSAEQITEALVQLSEAAQQTVESLRQSATAMEELNQASSSLHGSVLRFRLSA